MVTFAEALKITKNYLDIDNDPSIFIMEEETIEFEYGWFFFTKQPSAYILLGFWLDLEEMLQY